MTKTTIAWRLRRFATDALVGAGLFLATAALTMSNPSHAASGLLDEVSAAAVKVADASSPGFWVLAGVCSALFALNLAFFRHIRRSSTAIRTRGSAEL